MENFPKIKQENLKTKHKIGRGSYGIVELVEDEETGKQYAAKKIKSDNKSENSSITQEINSYSRVDHLSILKFYGYYPPNFSKGNFYHTILLEYIPNGSLQSIFTKKVKLSMTQKVIILYGIAAGMEYLHSQEIIHRDLKPANILIDDNFYPKICDFGVSFVSDTKMIKDRMDEIIGTPIYMAPEIFKCEPYTYKVDVYAFAIIAYELITEKPPFDVNILTSKRKLSKNVINGVRPNLSKFDISIQFFLNKCWSNNPLERPTFSEIIKTIEYLVDFGCIKINIPELYKYISLLDKNKYDSNLYKKLKSNDVDILNLKANMFYNGNGAPLDHKKAAEYYKKAADLGNDDATYKYAKMCLLGDGIPYNKDEGLKYLKKSIDSGSTQSMVYYSSLLFSGRNGIDLDIQKASQYIKMAHDKGDTIDFFMGYITLDELENGAQTDISAANAAAAKYLKKAADKGDPIAAFEYGEMIYTNPSNYKDLDEGIKYMKMSADQGFVLAISTYAKLIYDTSKYQNKTEAARYFCMAANQDDVESMYKYAVILFKGDGIAPNLAEAKKYFNKIAKRNDYESMFYHGMMILHGMPDKSLNIDKDKAIAYIKKAADMEIVEANFVFGAMLFYGYLGVINDEMAAKYLKFAADHDHIEASFIYANVLYNSKEKDKSNYKYYLDKFHKASNYNPVNYMMMKSKFAFYLSKYRYKENYLEKSFTEKGSTYSFYAPFSSIEKRESFSFDKVKDSADNGNVEDILEVGHMLKDGNGTQVNKKEAFKYFKMGADKNNGFSMFQCGKMLFYGDGITQNKDEGLKYIKKSTKFGSSLGKLEYAKILLNGDGIKVDKQKAIKYLKLAADEGNSEAMLIYGKMLINGDGVDVDIEKGVEYIKYSCEYDDGEGLFEYASMLYKGDKIPMNKKKAAKYFQKSIDKTNNEEAMFRLAFMLKDGDGIPKDEVRAFRYFKILSEQGNKEAMLEYSTILIDKKHNTKEALKYLKISADLGNVKSMILYARLSYNSITSIKEKFYKNFDETDDKNQIDLFFENTYKPSEVTNEIIKYYKMASDLGNEEALYEYGLFLSFGSLIPENKKEAAKFFKMSADKGNPKAAFIYGLMLLVGDNVPIDIKKSIHYIQIAIKKDNSYCYLLCKLLFTN